MAQRYWHLDCGQPPYHCCLGSNTAADAPVTAEISYSHLCLAFDEPPPIYVHVGTTIKEIGGNSFDRYLYS